MSAMCECGRPAQDGYLCRTCTRSLAVTIRHAPLWADQLGLVLARLTRYTDPAGRRTGPAPLPYNPAASDPARRLDGALRGACRAMGAPGAVTGARLGVVCAYLVAHIEDLRGMPTAGVRARAIRDAVADAEAVCDRPPEQWYAGKCPECDTDMYPSAGEERVTCKCGKSWDASVRRAELMRTVRGVVAPGPVIARALTTFGTEPVTPDLLRKWRHKNWLKVRKMTTNPATNWYRVGDVLDLVTRPRRRGKA